MASSEKELNNLKGTDKWDWLNDALNKIRTKYWLVLTSS